MNNNLPMTTSSGHLLSFKVQGLNFHTSWEGQISWKKWVVILSLPRKLDFCLNMVISKNHSLRSVQWPSRGKCFSRPRATRCENCGGHSQRGLFPPCYSLSQFNSRWVAGRHTAHASDLKRTAIFFRGLVPFSFEEAQDVSDFISSGRCMESVSTVPRSCWQKFRE